MQKWKKRDHQYFVNLIYPAVVFGVAGGCLTAAAVALYKALAGQAVRLSGEIYSFLRGNPAWIPAALAVLAVLSALLTACYRRHPNLHGGGIPTSVGILRGLISFHWLHNLAGVAALSMTAFLTGVPLGTEGPAVQIGTALGRGSLGAMRKKHRAWERYAMTGGACAGFTVATGAPISGLLFAVEEAHRSVSPMILMVSSVAVLSAEITSELISPLLGVSPRLFDRMSLPILQMGDMWIPLAVGVAVGLFSVAVLRLYGKIRGFFNRTLRRVPQWMRIFLVLAATLAAGLWSHSMISTGHHLVEELFALDVPVLMLICILLVRTLLTLSASSNGITGGLFLPLMALGAILAALTAEGLVRIGLHESFCGIVIMLGITACIAGMMKTPLTAVAFSIEVLSLSGNVLPVLLAAVSSYVITEIFSAQSINDTVLETRMEEIHEGRPVQICLGAAAVLPGSFAVGKQVRDVLWPDGLIVMALRHSGEEDRLDVRGDTVLQAGDALELRCSTQNMQEAQKEIVGILGEQELNWREE